jgi:hypothetical protein|tara:strand:- start:46 stop:567 length:522 start_codon:yes stop_codon:yes gene_type:complete
MGQEFFINSEELENKIRQLLPSQGGSGAGFDLSASTQIIPIIDLTESAQGSNLRQDLQSSLKFNSTAYNVTNATNTNLITTTGYFRFYGLMSLVQVIASATVNINIFDGATAKNLINGSHGVEFSGVGLTSAIKYDFICKIEAGQSVRATANTTGARISGVATQIASIDGELT